MILFMRIKFVYYKKDKKDDIKVGVKSTALKFGENTFQILSLLNLVQTSSLIFLGYKMNFDALIFLYLFLFRP